MAIKKFLKRFIQEEEGATAVEYAIMVALIGAVAIVAVTVLGTAVSDEFTDVAASINNAS